MKTLFLVFHGFQEYNGISKKIKNQVSALQQCGMDTNTCYYETGVHGERLWMIDQGVLVNLGKGIVAKIKKRISFKAILLYIKREEVKFIYIRYFHNSNPFTIHFVKALKELGVKIVLEIPTYPYDQEYINQKFNLYIDRMFRHTLCKYVDAIVTFSNDKEIFGQRTICISNGIDFNSIPLRKQVHSIEHELHLIGVAEIHYWHGFDRIIEGLKKYYLQNPDYKVYFHIVGSISGERERKEIEFPIRNYSLQSFVILHGPQHGEKLDALFEQADFAIGSLARHRSGIYNIKTLKNREYSARGFRFIYSETDEDFDCMPYVLKAPADESPIDISKLIEFCRMQAMSPQEIRNSIQHLSWKEQMKIISEDKMFQPPRDR